MCCCFKSIVAETHFSTTVFMKTIDLYFQLLSYLGTKIFLVEKILLISDIKLVQVNNVTDAIKEKLL